jgi:hypothetical protein
MSTRSVFKFINHASILATHGQHSLLTDPWYASNAFGSWYQNPPPRTEDILELLNSDKSIGVLISHGHDDHIDEWFIAHHLNSYPFLIPAYPSPGLETRLKFKMGLETRLIGERLTFGPFSLHQFINDDFSGHDAVITIEYNKKLVIHANDNWHEWPEKMIQEMIPTLSRYSQKDIFFLVQFGIADCFPMNYPKISTSDASRIISDRFLSYKNAIIKNLSRLGINHCFLYANQSQFNFSNDEISSILDKAKHDFRQDDRFKQLSPGDSVCEDHSIRGAGVKNPDFFCFRLKALENFINMKFRSDISAKFVPLTLASDADVTTFDPNGITYVASRSTWNLILTGELTLESIIIGGSGLIYTNKADVREHHRFISKSSYLIQNLIKREGVKFFLANS